MKSLKASVVRLAYEHPEFRGELLGVLAARQGRKTAASTDPIGKGKNGYIAFYKGKKVEVMADTKLQAQITAAAYFKAKKSYEVDVELAETDGKQVTHKPMFASSVETAAKADPNPWKATHEITWSKTRKAPKKTVKVMLSSDGQVYTKPEWDAGDNGDFSVHKGEWQFQGEPFDGSVKKL